MGLVSIRRSTLPRYHFSALNSTPSNAHVLGLDPGLKANLAVCLELYDLEDGVS